MTLRRRNDLRSTRARRTPTGYTISDPGKDTVTLGRDELRRQRHARSTPTQHDTSGGIFDCTFPDGPASSTVSVQVEGLRRRRRQHGDQTVTVNNVAPTVTLTGADDHGRRGLDRTPTATRSPIRVRTPDRVASAIRTAAPTARSSARRRQRQRRQLRVHLPRRPGRPRRVAIKVDRLRRRERHRLRRRPDRHGQQRRADGRRSSAGNDLSVNEGSTHTYSYTITDPGTDTVASVAVELRCQRHARWRAPSHTPTVRAASQCTFPDGADSSTVSAAGRPTPTAPPATPTRSGDDQQRRADGHAVGR